MSETHWEDDLYANEPSVSRLITPSNKPIPVLTRVFRSTLELPASMVEELCDPLQPLHSPSPRHAVSLPPHGPPETRALGEPDATR